MVFEEATAYLQIELGECLESFLAAMHAFYYPKERPPITSVSTWQAQQRWPLMGNAVSLLLQRGMGQAS